MVSEPSLSGRLLITSRVIDAPRDRVFAAFRDPAQLALWWGPAGFTNTFEEFDLRPGGRWRFVMHGPEGGHYPNESVFVDIAPGQRIVFNHVSPPRFEMTISFEDYRGRTKVGWRQVFETVEECARVSNVAIEANEQNLDRLSAPRADFKQLVLEIDAKTEARE